MLFRSDNNKSFRLDILEEYLLNAINELLKKCNEELLKNEFTKEMDRKSNQDIRITNLNKEKASFEKKLSESKLYFKTLYEDKLKGVITEEDFTMLRGEYSKDVESYQLRLEEINNELDEMNTRKDNSKDIESILKKYKHIDKLNKIIVDEFVEKIYIGTLDKETKSREIRIEWNFDL